jgi:cytochrome P450
MERVSQAPTDSALNQNPYAFYDSIRPLGPLVWWDDYNMPVAASHAAVSALLRDRRFGRENPYPPVIPEHQKPFYAIEAHSMLELEPPRHTRLRGLVLRAFTSRRIKELAPEIGTLSNELIDNFPDGPFNLLTEFAQKLPVIIIARLLGVPEEKAPDLLRWSNAMVRMYIAARTRADEDAAAQASIDFSEYLTTYIDARRATPADDLITHLIAAEEDGSRLSTDELITTCILLLNAGHEATVHALGNGVKTALETGLRPENPEAFAEEVLRFDPPLHMFTRYAMDDVEAFGHDFKKGEEVGLLLGSANRDPLAYADPNRFDPSRDMPAHTSFGAGLHFCVGAPLARLELSIALKALFARCPNLALATEPEYATTYHFHGLTRLMVTR